MNLELGGKVALVAASSQGLGLAIAQGFAREGAKVVMCGRDQASIEAAAEETRLLGADVLAVRADLTNPGDIENLVQRTIETFGGIDCLVTNAGGPPPGTFDRVTDSHWQTAFELNLMSAVRLVRATLPSMRNRGGGSVVMMTSSSVKQPIPNLLLSNVLRASVAALSKSLADAAPYLASSRASYITGATLQVDGGMIRSIT